MLWLATAGVVLWAAVLFVLPIYLRHAAINELKKLGTLVISDDGVSFRLTDRDLKSVDRLGVLLRRVRCKKLALALWGTPVSDLSPLAGLSGLTSLDLRDTSVSDLSPLAGLKKLAVVLLRSGQVVRIPEHLQGVIKRL